MNVAESLEGGFASAPDMATTVKCRVVRVLDGDTVQVTVQQSYTVRLLDCWAPEKRAPGGPEATEHLRKHIEANGANGILSVPWTEDSSKSWSMGRVLGNVWLTGSERSLSEVQVDGGHATKVKA